MEFSPDPTELENTRPWPDTEVDLENSVFFQTWNLINNIQEKKSIEAVAGSETRLSDALKELGEWDYRKERPLSPMESVQGDPSPDPLPANPIPKTFYKGMNCVLSNEDLPAVNRSNHQTLGHDYAELIGKDKYSKLILDAGLNLKPPPVIELPKLRGSAAQAYKSKARFHPSISIPKMCQTKKSEDTESQELHTQTQAVHSSSPEVQKQQTPQTVATPEKERSDDVVNHNNIITNRNNISVNLTFNMGQGQTVSGKPPEPVVLHDMKEVKAPKRRVPSKNRKTDSAIQTDDEDDDEKITESKELVSVRGIDASDIGLESTSAFPSVTPSRHNQNEALLACVAESSLPWKDYIDYSAVAAYTGESVRSMLDTADQILQNFIVIPDDNEYTEEELEEGESKIGVSIMRLVGVPQQLRHNIYNEALHNIRAIRDISIESVCFINHVIDWLSDGDGSGKEKLLDRVRLLAAVSTDFQPDSEGWVEFEAEFNAFTESVGEVMKQGYEVGKDAALHCSETIIDRLKNSKQEHLALLGPSLPGSNGTITSGSQPISERTSSTALAPTLPPIPENMDPDLSETALESEYEDEELMKLTEALKKIESGLKSEKNPDNQIEIAEKETKSIKAESEVVSTKIHHGPNPREWKRDAFMEAPSPASEHPITQALHTVCQKLTSKFVETTGHAMYNLQGSGNTPILGESQYSSRRESAQPLIHPTSIQETDANGNVATELQLLAAEVQKLAALTDSYFIATESLAAEVPEPQEECPPPPVPKRASNKFNTSGLDQNSINVRPEMNESDNLTQ